MGAERALRLDELRPKCRCERTSVTPISSGIVAPEEILIRVLVAPQHMKGNGKPKAAALSDAERTGLSVLREQTATDEEIRSVATGLVERARRAQGDKAGVFGVLRMQCGSIRNITAIDETVGAYCVYDTALKELPSHAEAFQRVFGVDPSLQEERRKRLFDSVNLTFISAEDFRNGLLADLAPRR